MKTKGRYFLIVLGSVFFSIYCFAQDLSNTDTLTISVLSQKNKEINDLRLERSNLDGLNKSLKKDLSELQRTHREEIDRLNDQVDMHKNQSNTKQEKIDELNILNLKLSSRNISLDSLNAQLGSVLITMKLEKDALNNLLSEMANDVKDRDDQLAEKIKEANKNKELVSLTKQELKIARESVNSQKQRADANRSKWFETREQVTKLSLEKSELDNKIQKAQNEVNSKVQQLSILNGRLKERGKIIVYFIVGSVIIILFAVLIMIINFFYRKRLLDSEKDLLNKEDDLFRRESLVQLFFYRRASSLARKTLFGSFILLFTVVFVVAIILLESNTAESLATLAKKEFWKIIATIGSPIFFVITVYNIFETKRIELTKLVSNQSN